ncbi:MAG: RDD family protein [Enterobacteriaceae bacterium]
MNNVWFVWRRAGSFVIDVAVAQMFAQLLIKLLAGVGLYVLSRYGGGFSLNSAFALPALLLLYVSQLLLFIAIFVGYHAICFRFLHNSMSRYFLHLKVISTSEDELTRSRYLKREFEKITLSLVTLGLYAFYSGAQFLTFGRPPWHDIRNQTQVISVD